MNMIDIHKLRVFCAVVDARSFSRAANNLRLSQPVVSSHIRHLEAAAGLHLLDRSKRPVTPTDEGKLLYDSAKKLLGGMEEIETIIADINNGKRGEVTVSTSGIIASGILPPLVLRFRETHPWVKIHVRMAKSPQVLDHISTGFSHFGLLLMKPPKPLSFRTAGAIELVALHAPDKVKSRRPTSPLEIIAEKGFAVPSSKNRFLTIAVKVFQKYGVTAPPVRYEVGSWEAAKRTVLQGTGVTILPRQWVSQELAQRQLEELNFGSDIFQIPVYVVHKHNRPFPPPVKQFQRFLTAALSDASIRAKAGGQGNK